MSWDSEESSVYVDSRRIQGARDRAHRESFALRAMQKNCNANVHDLARNTSEAVLLGKPRCRRTFIVSVLLPPASSTDAKRRGHRSAVRT